MYAYVIWLIHMCRVSHFYVWHDSLICVTYFDVWHDSFICVTQSYAWHGSFIYVTHAYVRSDWFYVWRVTGHGADGVASRLGASIR